MPAALVAVLALSLARRPASPAPPRRARRRSAHAARDASNPLDLAAGARRQPADRGEVLRARPGQGLGRRRDRPAARPQPGDDAGRRVVGDVPAELAFGPLHDKLAANPGLARKVAQLSMIASQPEAQRISSYSWGGTPSGIFKQTQKILCQNLTADPGTIPIFNTYFLHATLGGCPTPAQVTDYTPLFHAPRRRDGQGHRPPPRGVPAGARRDRLLQLRRRRWDRCPQWEADLRYEMNAMQALPAHGRLRRGRLLGLQLGRLHRARSSTRSASTRSAASSPTTPTRTGRATRPAGPPRSPSAPAARTSSSTPPTTASGPLLNKDRVENGNEDLCNPPGRGLGPTDTTNTGYPYADAWMWTHPPGNSSGCGGGPPGGVFWPARAEGEAIRANDQLGPGFPSQPY